MRDPFAALAGAMYRYRWLVPAFWVVLLLTTGPRFAATAADHLKGGGISIEGTASQQADTVLADEFDLGSQHTLAVVFHSSSLTVDDASFRDAVTKSVSDIKSITGVTRVTTFYASKGDTLVSSDRHTTIAPMAIEGDEAAVQKKVPEIREKLKGIGLDAYVVGSPAAAYDGQAAAREDLHRAEFVTLPVILIMLLLVFRTAVAAAVPLLLGVLSIALTTSLVGILGLLTDVSVFALNIGSLLGLGLSIDYCLIVITRYREELAIGQPPERALAITMATAGRSIVYSAVTVILAMGAITAVLAPIMIVRSISLAVLLVALLSIIIAMTLLPALLALLKHRLEWGRLIPKPREPRKGEVGTWYRFSYFIMRRPLIWLGACLVILLGLASPLATIAFGSPEPPPGTETHDGVSVVQQAFSPGQLSPVYIVVRNSGRDSVWTPELLQAVRDLTRNVAEDPRVSSVGSVSTVLEALPDSQFAALKPDALGPGKAAVAPFVNLDRNDDTTVISVISKYADNDQRTAALVQDIRGTIAPHIPNLNRFTVYVGGQTATVADYESSLFGRFPAVAGVVALVIFLILMMFFQSLALPVKAVLMNLISIGATFGILSIIFQHGFLSRLLGFTSTDYVTIITPGILYVMLFALSTDYEVFMLSRVKEYFQNFGHNEEAVAAGLQHTAGIITAAGLILVFTFGSFVVSSTVVLKEIGLGLALGVLLDSTVVRVVMVPATMRLLGAGNWWMPAWLKRFVPEISEEGARELENYTEAAAAPVGAVATPAAVPPSFQPVPALAGATGERTLTLTALPGLPASPAAMPSIGKAELLVSGTWDGVPVIPLSQDRSTRFGRAEANEVRLPSVSVSRWHARIDYVNGQYILTDLGSANGVYVNGARIAARPAGTVLRPADHIVIGGYTRVAFTLKPV
ncbi:MAG TPA: MMPL family transporter [Candidatus Acidoferrales bacterium]|nr:MMPL family transporter [Candidatus Acidoferrales bacterium]